MKRLNIIALVMMMFITLVACNKGESVTDPLKKTSMEKPEVKNEIVLGNDPIELTVWSYYATGWEDVFKEFQKEYPNVSINIDAYDYQIYTKKFMNSLENGDVPDIMITDSEQFGNFNSLNVLEDLLEPPYNYGQYKNDVPESLWKVGQSFDRKKVIGVPFSTTPLVTYYRADLMEKYGFPSDPEELGEYMEDPKNWLKIAETLKDDNIFIAQWLTDIMDIYNSGTPLYDEDLQFLRNNATFRQAINVSRKAHQNGLLGHNDVWMPVGEKAIKEDKVAMLYFGSWGAGQIEAWAPEQAGKWRVTRLPFDTYGWSNSSIFSIPKDSKNKEAAWKFIEFYNLKYVKRGLYGTVPAFLSTRNNEKTVNIKNDFLGGQEDQRFYEDLLKKTKEHTITPLDQKTNTLWVNSVNQGIEWGSSTDEIIESVLGDIQVKLGNQKQILLKQKTESGSSE